MKLKMKLSFMRIVSLLLIVCITAGFLPSVSFAADAKNSADAKKGPNPEAIYDYDTAHIYLCNTTTSSAENELYSQVGGTPSVDKSVSGISYDTASNTLNLSNFKGSGKYLQINEMGSDFSINLDGNSVIDAIIVWGFGYEGSVYFKGSGTLTVNPNADAMVQGYYQGIDIEAEEAPAVLRVSPETTLNVFGANGGQAVTIYYTSTSSDAIIAEGKLSKGQPAQKRLQKSVFDMYMTQYPLYTYGGAYYGSRITAVDGNPTYTMYQLTGGTESYGYTATEVAGESGLSEVPSKYEAVYSDYYSYTVSSDSDYFNAMSEVHFVPGNTVVTEKPVITTKTLPEGVVNKAYRAVLEASPCKKGNAISWSVIKGKLPDGLSLDGKTGVISGTPTTVGTSTFTVKASEAGAQYATASFSIKINNAAISFEGGYDLYLSTTDKGAIIPESDFSAFVNLSRELTAAEAADASVELYYNGNTAGEKLPVYANGKIIYTNSVFPSEMKTAEKIVFRLGKLTKEINISKSTAPSIEITAETSAKQYSTLVIKNEDGAVVCEKAGFDYPGITITNLDAGKYTVDVVCSIDGRGAQSLLSAPIEFTAVNGEKVTVPVDISKELSFYHSASAYSDNFASLKLHKDYDVFWYSDSTGTNLLSEESGVNRLSGETLYVKAVPVGYAATHLTESAIIPVTDGVSQLIDLYLPEKSTISVTGTVKYIKADNSVGICEDAFVTASCGAGSFADIRNVYCEESGSFSLEKIPAGTVITVGSVNKDGNLTDYYTYTVTESDISNGSLSLDITLSPAEGFVALDGYWKKEINSDSFRREEHAYLDPNHVTITNSSGKELDFRSCYNGFLLSDPSAVSVGEKLSLDFDCGRQYGSCEIEVLSENGKIYGIANPLYIRTKCIARIDVSRQESLSYSVLLYGADGKLIETRRNEVDDKTSSAAVHFITLNEGNYTAVFVQTSYLDSLEPSSYDTLAKANKLKSEYTASVSFDAEDCAYVDKSIYLPSVSYDEKDIFVTSATGVSMKQTYPGTVDIDFVCTPSTQFDMKEGTGVTFTVITSQTGQDTWEKVATRSITINGKSVDINRWSAEKNGYIDANGKIVLSLSASELAEYGGFPLRFSSTVEMTNPAKFCADSYISYYDSKGTKQTKYFGAYNEERNPLSISAPAVTADGSFTVYGVGPVSNVSKPYYVTIYADGIPVAKVQTDSRKGYYKASVTFDESRMDEYQTISFSAKGSFADGSRAYSSPVFETLYSSSMGALTKNEMFWYDASGKEKSIVIWDDGDPVNADKSYYISGSGYDTSYKWQLTFDNPDNVYNVNINCIDNGIIKQIPAERIGSSDIFETGKICLYGKTPDGAWVTYNRLDTMYMSNADDVTDSEISEVLDYMNSLPGFSEVSGTADNFSFLLGSGTLKFKIYSKRENITWDSSKITEFESMKPFHKDIPYCIGYEEGNLSQADGIFAIHRVMKYSNSDIDGEYFFVDELYTLASRTITVWDTSSSKAYRTITQIGDDPILQPLEYSELDAEFAAINRTEDILRVWYDYDKLVASAFMEKNTDTASVPVRFMGDDLGDIEDYIPDMFDLALQAQDGVPISAQDIYKLQRFYKDNEFCFTNLFKMYNSDNDPAFDIMRRRLKRVNEVRVLFGCIMLDELKSYLPQSLDDVTGISLAGKALEFVQDQVKDAITDKINGQLEKIYGSQAKSLAFDVYYAAKYFEKKESFFCSKLDWKNFPFDLYDPNEMTGGECQDMPSGPSGMLDPSGVIFEAVESNVIEGAQAVLYYYNGSSGVVANSNYFGIEPNPQTVGKDGFYQWFVPMGKWRVVASKDGYSSTDTGSSADYGLNSHRESDGYYYMPVLPVQLDVNIGLVSFEAPTVESVKATTEGIFITFSKYMSEAELSASNIGLYVNDELVTLSGKIVLADSEKVNEGSSVSYTKTVMLKNLKLSTSDKVQVVINNEVKSYAGVRMAERYDSGSIDVTEPVKLAAPVASVSSGEVEKNTVVTLSAEDGAVIYYTTDGTTPSKTSKIYKTGFIISENITIKAIAVKTGMKDSDVLSVSYTVKDEEPDEDPRPAKVTATMNGKEITDNSTVSAGYLKFTTATPGAQIYYTTNGNCAMTDEKNRILYEGPIYLEAGKTYYFRVRAYLDGRWSDGLPLHITVESSGGGTVPVEPPTPGETDVPDDPSKPDDPGKPDEPSNPDTGVVVSYVAAVIAGATVVVTRRKKNK